MQRTTSYEYNNNNRSLSSSLFDSRSFRVIRYTLTFNRMYLYNSEITIAASILPVDVIVWTQRNKTTLQVPPITRPTVKQIFIILCSRLRRYYYYYNTAILIHIFYILCCKTNETVLMVNYNIIWCAIVAIIRPDRYDAIYYWTYTCILKVHIIIWYSRSNTNRTRAFLYTHVVHLSWLD